LRAGHVRNRGVSWWFLRVGLTLGFSVLALVALLTSVLLHSNLPVVRQAATDLGNLLLADAFYGKLHIGAPSRLSLERLHIRDVRVSDEHGTPVVQLTDVRVELATWSNLLRWASSDEKLTIALPHARIEGAHVELLADARSGEPTLLRALTPRPAPPRPKGTTHEPRREVRVFFPELELGKVTAKASAFSSFEPTLSSVQSQLLITARGAALDISRLGANVKGVLDNDLVGTGTLKLRAPGQTQATFAGFLGDVEVQIGATIEGRRVELTAKSQSASPAGMRKLLEEWPFREPVSAELHAQGEIPKLDVRARCSTENSSVDLDGNVDLGASPNGRFALVLRNVDARAFLEKAPETHLHGTADVVFDSTGTPPNRLHATVDAKTDATTIAGHDVPPLKVDLAYRQGVVSGRLHIFEPKAEITADVSIRPEGEIEAKVHVPRLSMQESKRIPKGPRGLLALDADLELDGTSLSAHANGRVDQFQFDELSARRVSFEAKATTETTNLGEPQLDLDIELHDARFRALHYGHVHVTAKGTRHIGKVTATLDDPDGRSLEVAGVVHETGRVEQVTLTAKRYGLALRAEVAHADPRIPAIEVTKLSLQDGSAELEGRVRYRPGLLEGELSARQVDLTRVAEAVGLPPTALRGTLNSDSTFVLGKDISKAHIVVGLTDASIKSWGRARLELDATLRDRTIHGSIAGSDQTTQVILTSTFDVELAGHALELASYEGATGSAEVAVNNVRLSGLDLFVKDGRVSDVDGLVGLRARLERTTATGWPSALIELGAQELGGKFRFGDELREVRGFASYSSVLFNADEKRVFGSGMLGDPSGPLVTVTGAVALDLDAFVADSRAAFHAFQREQINLVVGIPRRELHAFPLLEPEDVPAGAFSGQITLYGTPSAPEISALLDLYDLAPRNDHSRPVSAKLQVQYAPDHGKVDAKLQGTWQGQNVLLGELEGVVPLGAFMGVARWNADAKVMLDHFPLELVPQLADTEVRGLVSGMVELQRETALELGAALELEETRVGQGNLGNGTLTVNGAPGQATAHLQMADGKRLLEVKLLALGRDPEQLPLPTQVKSIGISLDGKRVNAALLGPSLRNILARLHGELDVDLTCFLERTGEAADATWTSRIEGTAALGEGSAYIDALGIELHDIQAQIKARPSAERTLVELTNLEAKARTNDVNFEGRGQLFLEGTEIHAGDAEVLLRSVPITLQGVSLGKASGRAALTVERAQGWDVPGPHEGGEYLVLNVDLEQWNMKAARSVGRRLIDLSRNPDVVVLQAEVPQKSSSERKPVRVFITLKRGARFGFGDINLPLEGEAQADYDEKMRLSGELRLQPGSRLPIMGMRFDVLSGTIRLVPEQLNNPELDIALSGTTPEGNLINVTVGGTLKEPEMDPPPSELQALFGGGAATLLGGGVQALGFNELLGESVGAVELRVAAGAEEEDDPSYAAAVQIGPDLWFEGGYQRSQDSGLNQNQSDVFSGSVDYRFRQNWSLKTRLGNAGGGVDVLWQHRY
jgi:hypothetical protein